VSVKGCSDALNEGFQRAIVLAGFFSVGRAAP
jgi:hypothetical protein